VPYDGSIEVYFAFTDFFTSYEKYPDTIFSGLAKIGGLFAALKISLFLLFTNSFLYKRKLKMRQPSPDSQDDERFIKKSFQPFKNATIEEKYSIENFERLLNNVEKQEACIKKLKKRYAQMEKKIESITNQ
jgi:ribosomal protein S10